jgi:hypothetical protein
LEYDAIMTITDAGVQVLEWVKVLKFILSLPYISLE